MMEKFQPTSLIVLFILRLHKSGLTAKEIAKRANDKGIECTEKEIQEIIDNG